VYTVRTRGSAQPKHATAVVSKSAYAIRGAIGHPKDNACSYYPTVEIQVYALGRCQRAGGVFRVIPPRRFFVGRWKRVDGRFHDLE
jgi:hypothetical protein